MSSRDRSWLRPAFVPQPRSAAQSAAELHPDSRSARIDDRAVLFSDREYAVVELLLTHPRVLITREELAAHAWGAPDDVEAVTSAVKRIRERLRSAGVDASSISTIHALGYRWDPPEDDRQGLVAS